MAMKLLKDLGCEDQELSILLTDDKEIKGLNKEFRKKNKATDVLSFSQAAQQIVGKIVGQVAGQVTQEVTQQVMLQAKKKVKKNIFQMGPKGEIK